MSKSKKKKDAFADLHGLIKQTKEQIQTSHTSSSKGYIPNIIEFVESPEYLGFSSYNPPIGLYPIQQIMLKVFYRGTVGNEDLILTEEEIEIIQKSNLINDINGNVLDKYLSDKTFRELVLIWGRRCVSEDTRIVDPSSGRLWTFGELWNFGRNTIDCFTYDENVQCMRKISKAKIIDQGKKEVYLIELNNGYSIEVTENQPMLTENGWQKTSSIHPGDKVAITSIIPFFGNSSLNENDASILGYLTSSKITAQDDGISILTTDNQVVSDFYEKSKKINSEIKLEELKSSEYSIYGSACKYILKENGTSNKEKCIASFLSMNGLLNKSRKDKSVPPRIFLSSKRSIAAYLNSIISADADIKFYVGSTQFYCRFDINMPNEQMARDVQHLLHRFGIIASLKNKNIDNEYSYVLSCSKKTDIKKIVEDIGFIHDNTLLEDIKDKCKNIEVSLDEVPLYFPVTSIRKKGIKRTFDLEVSDVSHLQNFVANGFICHNCVSGDGVLVDSRTGERYTFEQLWKEDKTISSWTYNELTKQMEIVDNCGVIPQGKRKCYRITAATGHSIEVTENHPILTRRGWVEAGNLKDGDSIAVVESTPFFGTSNVVTEDEAAILGYMTADGNCSQNSCFFTAKNEEILEDFKTRIGRFSENIEVIKDTWSTADSKDLQYKIVTKEQKYEKYFNEDTNKVQSKPSKNDLAALLEKHGLRGHTAHKKVVPPALFTCPQNVIAAYLRALFSCDGGFTIRQQKTSKFVTIEFYSVNKKQCQLVQELLHRFGILSSVKTKISNTKIVTEGKLYEYNDHVSYRITFSKADYIRLFIEKIGFLGKKKYDQIIPFLKDVKGHQCDCIQFTKILNKEDVGDKETFDLQVSDQWHLQNFCCNTLQMSNSGKDFACSIIALYEALKLLESPGGNPHALYNLSGDVPFTILSIANSSSQASIVYNQIREKMLKSSYFDDKYIPDGITSEYIYLLTPEDKKMNQKLSEKGLPLRKGSIQIRIGHSESNTLVGLDCFVIIFDEIGLYRNTDGTSSGDALYHNLTPALQTYVRNEVMLDKNDNPIIDEATGKNKTIKVYDGKIICISTPRGQEGIFYDLYKDAHIRPHRLMCRAPTWIVNPRHSEESLREENPNMSPDKFSMEFGAMFSGSAGDNFFTKEVVDSCFREKRLLQQSEGRPGVCYFAHLDPATSSHNYALCMCHKEHIWNEERKQRDFVIIVDHLRFWSPNETKPIVVEEIDEYMLKMSRRFYLYLVTYDQWESSQSIMKLRQWGVPAKETRFGRNYKKKIYDNLEQLATSGRLLIPEFPLLRSEMYNLQRKYLDGSGYKVMPKKDADVTTDDLVDALAGAVYNATQPISSRLPGGKLVDMAVNSSSNNILWRSMQGTPYGYGPGQHIANRMQNRNKHP